MSASIHRTGMYGQRLQEPAEVGRKRICGSRRAGAGESEGVGGGMEIFKGAQSHSGRVREEKRQHVPTHANTRQNAPTRCDRKPGIDCPFARL